MPRYLSFPLPFSPFSHRMASHHDSAIVCLLGQSLESGSQYAKAMFRKLVPVTLLTSAVFVLSCGGDNTNVTPATMSVNDAPVATIAPSTNSGAGGISSDGQPVLIEASDVPNFRNVASPQDVLAGGYLQKELQACDGGDALVEEIGAGGSDVVLGNNFSERPINVEGGQSVLSVALRGRDGATASRTQALLSSIEFWDCVTNQSVSAIRAAGGTSRNVGTLSLPSVDQEGLSAATQTTLERTTTGPTHTPFTDYTDEVVVRVGDNIVLLILDDNDGPVPEDLRTRLTALIEQRLKALL